MIRDRQWTDWAGGDSISAEQYMSVYGAAESLAEVMGTAAESGIIPEWHQSALRKRFEAMRRIQPPVSKDDLSAEDAVWFRNVAGTFRLLANMVINRVDPQNNSPATPEELKILPLVAIQVYQQAMQLANVIDQIFPPKRRGMRM